MHVYSSVSISIRNFNHSFTDSKDTIYGKNKKNRLTDYDHAIKSTQFFCLFLIVFF